MRTPFAALTIAAVAALCSGARAYNDAPGADNVFPSWFVPETASPAPGVNRASIAYEIYPSGVHGAELHFRNISSVPLHFDYWVPGRQEPGDNARITLEPYFESRLEVHRTVRLTHGRPGLTSSRLRIYDVRQSREDTGPSHVPLARAPEPSPPDATWMPVCPLGADIVVLRSELQASVSRDGERLRLALRNPSRRDLHLGVAIPALGLANGALPRLFVAAGAEASIDLPASPLRIPAALVRVFVCDVRVGDDTGTLYARDRSADAGWFPLATSDGSAQLPREMLLATVERLAGAPESGNRARVRFRSHMRTPVRLSFVIDGYQAPDAENDPVTVQPGAEADVAVVLARPGDARLAIARVRVFEVSHREDE